MNDTNLPGNKSTDVQSLVEIYIYVLATVQTVLFVNMLIYEFNRLFLDKDLKVITLLHERKNNINFWFMLLTAVLMAYLFNPFTSSPEISISGNLKSVLFSAATIQILFILTHEDLKGSY
jgi:hypothetical protein